MSIITCKNVSKSYLSRVVLQNLHFEIKENSFTGIIGRNGVGKTTLMKIIAGFTELSTGELHVFKENPYNNLTVGAHISFIDDTMAFPENMTLQAILNEYKRFYNGWDHELAIRLLNYFQLQLKSKPRILSKGKRSIFHAIIGIASRSPLTIFDEPTNGMDSATRKDFYRALLKDYIAHPRTILLSSHHLEEIENLLEDVLLIDRQNVLFHGSISALQGKFITLMGPENKLKHYMETESVIAIQQTTPYVTLTVNNRFTDEELEVLRAEGIRISNVSANDAYIALTEKTKGGIDDVFH